MKDAKKELKLAAIVSVVMVGIAALLAILIGVFVIMPWRQGEVAKPSAQAAAPDRSEPKKATSRIPPKASSKEATALAPASTKPKGPIGRKPPKSKPAGKNPDGSTPEAFWTVAELEDLMKENSAAIALDKGKRVQISGRIVKIAPDQDDQVQIDLSSDAPESAFAVICSFAALPPDLKYLRSGDPVTVGGTLHCKSDRVILLKCRLLAFLAPDIRIADQLYREGRQAEAVTKYKKHFAKVAPNKQAATLARIIEHAMRQGEAKEAEHWIELGLDRDLAPTFVNPATAQLAEEVRRVYDRKQEARRKELALKEERDRREKEAEKELLDAEQKAEAIRLQGERDAQAALERDAKIKMVATGLKAADLETRRTAVQCAKELGPDAKPFVEDLAPLVLDRDRKLRLTTMAVLKRVTPEAKVAVPQLSKALFHKDPETRYGAIAVLTALKADAKDAAPTLITLFADKEHRQDALTAVVAIHTDAIPALVKGLESPNVFVRQWSARALGEIGSSLHGARTALRANWQSDASKAVRDEAEEALKSVK